MSLKDKIIDKSLTVAIVGAIGLCGLIPYRMYQHFDLTWNHIHNKDTVRYEDVNGDSIKDRIEFKLERKIDLFSRPRLQEEVLYGMNVNGKTIYLPKEQIGQMEK